MHRVASKIALPVAVVTAAGVWIVAAIASSPALQAVTAGLFAGAAAYAAARRLVGRRVRVVATALNELVDQTGRDTGAASTEGDELEQLVRRSQVARTAVRKQVAELSSAEKVRRDYVGDVSHEIRTPVFAIQGFAETLLNGGLDDPTVSRSFVEKIFNHAARLEALASDLSQISGLESGVLELSLEDIDAGLLLQEAAERLELAARKKGIDVRMVVLEDVPSVRADRDRICQVLTNLVDNAVKYTNPDGWVELRAERDGVERVRFAVQDNGIGISGEDVGRVTERFYRAEKSRSRGEGGTGLGLSIVKHILAAHGTSIHIESRVGEGSTFSFTLPTADSAGSA